MIIDMEDMEYIWDIVQKCQMIFHPDIAPDGKFDYKKFYYRKNKKPMILFVDRNILSGLIKFCEQGSLKDKGESQLIGIIMTWAEMNNISISAGPAVQERATQINDQEQGLIELNKFLNIFDTYPGQMWLSVAKGQITEIPQIRFPSEPAKNITAEYANGCDHYYMTVASMVHMVKLYRNHVMQPVEKIMDFIQWTYDNLLVSQYVLTYVILLFTNQKNIKIPKCANSMNIGRIMSGCQNQAWDITYLSNWSTLYSNTEEYAEEFLFATNDILLKRIFINTHGRYGINGLLYEVCSKKDYDKILDLIENKMENRVKPDFGSTPYIYFQKLIDKEIDELKKVISIE